MIKDLYKILEIRQDASKIEIKNAYRKLALHWHPDKNKSPNAHEKFIEINEAYLILSDDEARAKYDREYERHFAFENEETVNHHTQEQKEPTTKADYQYADYDLNNWTKNARKQAEKFASLTFDEFSKMVLEVIKETGIQFGNAFLYAIGGVLAASAIFGFIFGIADGDASRIIMSVVLGVVSFFLISYTHKQYEK